MQQGLLAKRTRGVTPLPQTLLEGLFEELPFPLVQVLLPGGVIRRANQAFTRLFPVHAGQSQTLFELLEPRPLVAGQPTLQALLARGKAFSMPEIRCRSAGSREHPFFVRGFPEGKGGETLLLFFQSLVDRRAWVQELERERAHFRALFIMSPQGTALVDHEGVLAEVNPSLEELFEYPPQHLRGRRAETLLGEDLREGFRDSLKAWEGRNLPLRLELSLVKRSGQTFPAEVLIRKMPLVGGEIWMVRDLSLEREQARQKEHQLRLQTLGELAGGVAHEINNPLGFLMANHEVLGQWLSRRLPRLLQTGGTGLAAWVDEVGALLEENLEGLARIARATSVLQDLVGLREDDPDGAGHDPDLNRSLEGLILLLDHRVRERIDLTFRPGPLGVPCVPRALLNGLLADAFLLACSQGWTEKALLVSTWSDGEGIHVLFKGDRPEALVWRRGCWVAVDPEPVLALERAFGGVGGHLVVKALSSGGALHLILPGQAPESS